MFLLRTAHHMHHVVVALNIHSLPTLHSLARKVGFLVQNQCFYSSSKFCMQTCFKGSEEVRKTGQLWMEKPSLIRKITTGRAVLLCLAPAHASQNLLNDVQPTPPLSGSRLALEGRDEIPSPTFGATVSTANHTAKHFCVLPISNVCTHKQQNRPREMTTKTSVKLQFLGGQTFPSSGRIEDIRVPEAKRTQMAT